MISFLLSLIVTFFVIHKTNIEPIISVLVLVTSFILINFSIRHIKKKYNKTCLILSLVFSIIYVICDSVEKTYFINIFDRFLFLDLSGYFIIFYFSLMNLFMFMDKYIRKKEEDRKIEVFNRELLTDSKFSFLVNFGLIFIVDLLLLIKCFPGNLTYDSYNELMQAKGLIPLMNNHSILHVGLLTLFVKFGLLFKSMNLGVFLYLVFQIGIVSLVLSYALYFMAKQKVPFIFRLFALLIFAFHPINMFYSITLWKDILFSLVFVIYTILIYYISIDNNYFKDKKNIIYFIIISILLMYLRNNGVYIIIISYIVLFIIYRNIYKKLLPIFLGVIIGFFLSKTIIFHSLNISDFETKEVLSVPSQSIARIYKYDYDKLTDKEKNQIEKFYSDKIGEVYNPIISDNTKNELNQKYLKNHKKDYVLLNLKLSFKYNKRYIESFISNNYGYYYVNTYYPSIVLQDYDDIGIKHSNIDFLYILLFYVIIFTLILLVILWNIKEKRNILLFILLIPVLLGLYTNIKENILISMLFNIGFYVTIFILLFIYNIKNKKNVIYYIPVLILLASMLFSPVYAEFRYLYPLFLLVPIFIGLTMKKTDE